MIKVAALFVAKGGCYFGLPDVDPWDEERDARLYAGPHPVVAHPPCQRWGRYWGGGPNPRARCRRLGADGGCFAAAIAAVRKWGGVLEHPEASHAWSAFGLQRPPKSGGWVDADRVGWTCCVEQGNYGHKARKATWLYVVGSGRPPPELVWGPSVGLRLDEGFRSKEEAAAARRSSGWCPSPRLSAKERIATPFAFRDLLLSIARGCRA